MPVPRPFPRLRAALFASTLLLSISPLPAAELTEFRTRWVWSTFGPTIGHAGFEVGDIDSDGRLDLVVVAGSSGDGYSGSGYWYQAALDDGELTQRWSSLPFDQSVVRLRLADSGPDRLVVVATTARVHVFDGASKELLASYPIEAGEITDMVVGDLNGDDQLESVVCTFDDLLVYDLLSGTLVAPGYGFGCADLALGDTDGDDLPELALAGNPFGGFVLDGASLEVEWADLDGFGATVELVDTDHDGLDDLVARYDLSDVVRATAVGAPAPHWSRVVSYDARIDAVDVDGDGFEEILLSTRWDPTKVVEETSGLDKWSFLSTGAELGGAASGDLDQDEIVELLVASGDYSDYREGIDAIDGVTHQVEAASLDLRGPFHDLDVVDADGDGELELVTVASASDGYDSGARFVRFDWRQQRLSGLGPADFGAADERRAFSSVAAQLDDDPALELCATLDGYSERRLLCVDGDSGELEWEVGSGDVTPFNSLVATQLDGDPGLELVAGSYEPGLFAFQGDSGWLKWSTPDLSSTNATFSIVRIADVAGSAVEEIVAGGGSYGGDILVLEKASGLPVYGPHAPDASAFDVAQLDLDESLEVVVAFDYGGVAELDIQTGVLGPTLAVFPDRVVALRVIDVTRDGLPDLVALVEGGFIRVYDLDAGAEVWVSPFVGFGAGENDSLFVRDHDGDTVPEIAVNTGVGFAIFDVPLIELFSDGFESGDDSAWL